MNLFEIVDKSGRKIGLSQERWKHIKIEHPEIKNIDQLIETLVKPLKITPSKYDPDKVRYYYHFEKERKKYETGVD